jgi:hypothetical protein
MTVIAFIAFPRTKWEAKDKKKRIFTFDLWRIQSDQFILNFEIIDDLMTSIEIFIRASKSYVGFVFHCFVVVCPSPVLSIIHAEEDIMQSQSLQLVDLQ